MVPKNLRPYLEVIAEEGAKLIEIIHGTHYKLILERAGVRRMVVCPKTTSDKRRSAKNWRSDLRRAFRT